MSQSPLTKYEYDIEKLMTAYERAFNDILIQLQTQDLSNFTKAQQTALLKDIGDRIKELDASMCEWVDENIKSIAMDGVVNTIVALGVAKNIEEAERIAKFNRLNKNMVDAVIADTQADLLAVTTNVNAKVRATVQSVAAQVLRANVTKGNNHTYAVATDLVRQLREQLGESLETGIIDARGRRWKPTTYARVVVNTKMMKAHKEATVNEAVSRNALYATISKHSAKDACSKYEGKVVKLSPDAFGSYPYYQDLPNNEIFHPNCGHILLPTRHPDKYEKDEAYEQSKANNTQAVEEPTDSGVVHGRVIIDNWERRPDSFEFEIEDIINHQGFDGLPKIVDEAEFIKACKASNFYAERTYSADSADAVKLFQDELYHGKWYVACTGGGASYGQGMYCAGVHDLTDITHLKGIGREMQQYIRLNNSRGNEHYLIEGITLDPSAKILRGANEFDIKQQYYDEWVKFQFKGTPLERDVADYIDIEKELIKMDDEIFDVPEEEIAEWDARYNKLVDRRDSISRDTVKQVEAKLKEAKRNFKDKDAGVMCVEMGYDAIDAYGHGRSDSYTIILNRTKVIFNKGGSLDVSKINS